MVLVEVLQRLFWVVRAVALGLCAGSVAWAALTLAGVPVGFAYPLGMGLGIAWLHVVRRAEKGD